MHVLDVATAAGGALIAAGLALSYVSDPETPRALVAAAAALLCPLALVRFSRRAP